MDRRLSAKCNFGMFDTKIMQIMDSTAVDLIGLSILKWVKSATLLTMSQ